MDAEALLGARAKDLQALTLRLSPPARPRRLIGWAIDEHLRTDLVELLWMPPKRLLRNACMTLVSLRERLRPRLVSAAQWSTECSLSQMPRDKGATAKGRTRSGVINQRSGEPVSWSTGHSSMCRSVRRNV